MNLVQRNELKRIAKCDVAVFLRMDNEFDLDFIVLLFSWVEGLSKHVSYIMSSLIDRNASGA